MSLEKQFVPYELAVKLKELGFDWECIAIYKKNRKFKLHNGVIRNFKLIEEDLDHYLTNYPEDVHKFQNQYYLTECTGTTAPLWQQAFDWFRVNHNLMGNVQYFTNSYFCYTIDNMEGKKDSNRLFTEFKTHEEARQACLEKLIELVENDRNINNVRINNPTEC